jgi:hypothetical protein
MEVIDIGDLEPINIDLGSSSSSNSVNFGPGIELLMNEKKKSSSNSTNVDLGEIDELESQLHELSSANEYSNTKTLSGLSGFTQSFSGLTDMFSNGGSSSSNKEDNIKLEEYPTDSNLGNATMDSMGNTKTWDGFTKIGEVPQTASKSLNDREKRRKKRVMIQKLQEWYDKGFIKHNSHFDMESNYEEVEDEYESALEDKRKKDSIKLQGWWFITFVNSLEYANSAFNPFDINLDGWGEQISEDIDSYEEIFSELHEKYKGGKLSPELSLLLRLGFSAAVVNFTNKALSSATPAFNDVIKQSPELMKMFTNATVNSMSQQSPGFAFANNMMNDSSQGPSRNMGPPPAPVETKNIPPPPRPGQMQFTERPVNNPNANRPDIMMGRGTIAQERSEPMDKNMYERPTTLPQPTTLPREFQRPEMRGPQTDIDNILSGLKTKTVDIHEDNGDDSMISISSLKDMQGSNIPKKSNRRRNNGSNKNTISLDI